MKKNIIIVALSIIFLFISIDSISAYTAVRNTPTNKLKGGVQFDIQYKVTSAPNEAYVLTIDDAISGGCTCVSGGCKQTDATKIKIPMVQGAPGQLVSYTTTIKAPSSGGPCVFQGTYIFSNDNENLLNFEQDIVTICDSNVWTNTIVCSNGKLYKKNDCGDLASTPENECNNLGCKTDNSNPVCCTSSDQLTQKCVNNNTIYNFNSCNKQIEPKVKDCPNGCTNNDCTACNPAPNKCVSNKIYAYTSCGQGNLVQDCASNGCTDGAAQCSGCVPSTNITNWNLQCSGNDLYWYDNCDNKKNKNQTCSYKCENDECVECVVNSDKEGWYLRCDEDEETLYYYDNCGNKTSQKKDKCDYGCDEGSSKCSSCQSTDKEVEFKCYQDKLYWYDNCGARTSKVKESCTFGCVEDDDKCNGDPCKNNIEDLGEADADCGGTCREKCSDNLKCLENDDCQSNLCISSMCKPDKDLDGKTDSMDTCPDNQNPTQEDFDGDSIGDICDDDIDGDGMPNIWEQKYNFKQKDPSEAANDPDNDGLTNYEEYTSSITYPNINPLKFDTDGDKYNDNEELTQQTDPTDPNSKPSSNLLSIIIWPVIIILILFIVYIVIKKSKGKKEYKEFKLDKFPMKPPMPMQTAPSRPRTLTSAPPRFRQLQRPAQTQANQTMPQKMSDDRSRINSFLNVFGSPKKEEAAVKQKEVVKEEKVEKKAAVQEEKKPEPIPKIDNVFKKLSLLAQQDKPSSNESKKTFNHLRKLAESDIITHNKISKTINNIDVSNKSLKKDLTTFKKELKEISESLNLSPIVASVNGAKYHKAGCIAMMNLPKSSIVLFKNTESALKKGLKPCNVCFE